MKLRMIKSGSIIAFNTDVNGQSICANTGVWKVIWCNGNYPGDIGHFKNVYRMELKSLDGKRVKSGVFHPETFKIKYHSL